MKTQIEQPPRDGALPAILQGYQSGLVLDEMGAAIRAVTEAALLAGKAGKVLLELTFAVSGNAIAVTPKVTTKIPKPEPQAAIFFYDDDYNLTRDDPRQIKLPLRVVEGTEGASEPIQKAGVQ